MTKMICTYYHTGSACIGFSFARQPHSVKEQADAASKMEIVCKRRFDKRFLACKNRSSLVNVYVNILSGNLTLRTHMRHILQVLQ